MTIGCGSFSSLNVALLLVASCGIGLFAFAEASIVSPLIPLAMFRDPALSASLSLSALVSTVMMTTLVVGSFYLSRALGLNPATVGIILSIGPIISAFSGVFAGRFVDRSDGPFMVIIGLIQMAAGSTALSVLPAMFGTTGYIAAIPVLTPGYLLFQAGNNTAVMMDARGEPRGGDLRLA